jgi:nucleotide-binding universal stress UspA family protein
MAILVAYDGSEPARDAVEYAIKEHAEKEVVLLRVVDVASGATEAGFNLAQEKLRELRNEVQEEISDDVLDMLEEADIEFDTEVVFGDPAREIVSYAEDHDIEGILVGSHGRKGVSRVFLGSVAEKVVRRAPVPVTVVP